MTLPIQLAALAVLAFGVGLLIYAYAREVGQRAEAQERARRAEDALRDAIVQAEASAAPLPTDDDMRRLGMPDASSTGGVRQDS